MNSSIMVSFVLPAYKGKFLKESIASILSQTYANFELVIVNDCSPDNIYDIVSLFNDNRIKYYENHENIGGKDLVDNWNHCLQYATGEWVIMASDDDVYEPNFVSEMILLVNKYPDVNLAHSRLRIINAKGETVEISDPSIERECAEEFIFHVFVKRRKQVAPDFMFRASAMKECGGFVNFPKAWGSDDATWCKLALVGGCVAYSFNPLFSWRCSGDNISSLKNNLFEKAKARVSLANYFEEEILPNLKNRDMISNYYGILLKSLANKAMKQELSDLVINSRSFTFLKQVIDDHDIRLYLGASYIRKILARFFYVKFFL